jgi:peptide/nickel transport system ATP-binding protein
MTVTMQPTTTGAPLVIVEQLVKHYPVRAGLAGTRGQRVRSVDGVSLTIRTGEVLGLVGESGCGKTTLGRAMLGLTPADSGRVLFDGADIAPLRGRSRKALRRSMQIVFQDPYAAFDPLMRLGTSLTVPLSQHRLGTPDERRQRVLEVLDQVGLDESFLPRRPHECSGGQLQRLVIARALLLNPRFLVCDEPTSALDASVRAQILNLLADLRQRLGLTLLLISHDLRVVRHLCDRVAVMYLGKIVEVADRADLFDRPAHPYTHALLSASLPEEPSDQPLADLRGEPPSPINPPSGCPFHPRCPKARDDCRVNPPALLEIGRRREVSCHYWAA